MFVISEIKHQLCQNVIGNYNKRVDVCEALSGDQLTNFFFRTQISNQA